MNEKGGLKFKNSGSEFVSKPAGPRGGGVGGGGRRARGAAVFEIINICPFVLAKRRESMTAKEN
jgi:hypothetical protein